MDKQNVTYKKTNTHRLLIFGIIKVLLYEALIMNYKTDFVKNFTVTLH